MLQNLKTFILNITKISSTPENASAKPKRFPKRLTREDIVQRIEANGGSFGLDLSGQNLSDVDLSGMDLYGINFSRATLNLSVR